MVPGFLSLSMRSIFPDSDRIHFVLLLRESVKVEDSPCIRSRYHPLAMEQSALSDTEIQPGKSVYTGSVPDSDSAPAATPGTKRIRGSVGWAYKTISANFDISLGSYQEDRSYNWSGHRVSGYIVNSNQRW